jgi:transcription antitermination protein NusB
MILRRKSREFSLQMLFQWDMTRQKPLQIEKTFWRTARAAESTRKFANELFEGAVEHVAASDKLIEKHAKNWRLDRMAAIDRNILRLAAFELRGKTPPKVVLNEALELAKKYSSAEAGPFLNGILDAILKTKEA